MRVCILTYRLHSNVGFLLQAYALQQAILRMGHDVQTAALFDKSHSGVMRFFLYFKRFILLLLSRGKNRAFFEYYPTPKEQSIINRNTLHFIENNIHLTPEKYDSSTQLKSLCRLNYDAFIVGSDQVWRRQYARGHISNFFLDFVPAENKKVILGSYAASFGKNEMDYSSREISLCKKAIQRFKAVSVREDFGIELCKKYFQVNAQQVMDPTLLLNRVDYMNLVSEKKDFAEPFGFSYILDKTSFSAKTINMAARHFNMPVYDYWEYDRQEEENRKHIKIAIFPKVEDFLNCYNKASFILTDSFHGTVFSIIFRKPFLTIINTSRGAGRFYSLLSMFHLEDRLIMNDGKKIDWNLLQKFPDNQINTIIQEEKKKSCSFLEKLLHD